MPAQSEPPSSCGSPSLFRIGRDSKGHWVVQDDQRLYGGLFVDRSAALKFAMFENGHRPQAVIMVPGIFELELAGGTPATHKHHNDQTAALGRVA